MMIECVNGHKVQADIADERGDVTVFMKMRGHIGQPVGVRAKDKNYCSKCYEQIPKEER